MSLKGQTRCPIGLRDAIMAGTWIFGYGSLVYRCGFEYEEKRPGYVKDWKRVFWQGSTDHRGTPDFPGRTVTLHKAANAQTWGMAYRLPKAKEREILEYLEVREKQYDLREECDVFSNESEDVPILKAITYIGSSNTATNKNFLGPPDSIEALALQVVNACGPSGPNRDYVFGLADAMRELDVEDEELFALEGLVRDLESKGE